MRSIMILTVAWFAASLAIISSAEEDKPRINRVVEPVTMPNIKNIHRVVAAKTPSGFEVPRYVSLKFGKTNGRAGPSQNHRILWEYRKRGLPVIVVAETELWRKIRDVNGDEAWVYRAGLSGERSVITMKSVTLQRQANSNSRIIALAEKGAILRLDECENGWCQVWSTNGYKGWVPHSDIWGAEALY